MNNKIMKFNFNCQPINVIKDADNNSWFKAKTVAKILGYTNRMQAIRKNVWPKDVITRERTVDALQSQCKFISEVGVYSLILKSKLESAKIFKH